VFGMLINIRHTLISLTLLLTAPCAAAAVTFSYSFDQSSYAVAPGAAVLVPVYLTETTTDGSTSLLASEGGLFGAGVSLSRDSAPSHPALITLVDDNEIDFNDTFFGNETSRADDLGIIYERADLDNTIGVLGMNLGDGRRHVLLGSFTIQAGDLPGQFTVFTARDYYVFDDTVTWNLPSLVLDSRIASASVTITTVPEPWQFPWLAVAALVWRRRGGRAARAG
jgi:hypothetical protein